jgi:pimeloyl-ACP methyl ester carboxylesterase
VNAAGPSFERYRTRHGEEWLMRIGAADGPPILFLPPLFEELNRTRALIAAIMRRLAAEGLSCLLPDLPGTGESERPLEAVGWEDWMEAVAAAAAETPRVVASLRGGCLLDSAVPAGGRWRFAPAEGLSLVRDLERAGLVSGGGAAGYAPSAGLLEALREASPSPEPGARTVRLASDRGEADAKLEGPALWRRSEPSTSSELASSIASDITGFARQCGAF